MAGKRKLRKAYKKLDIQKADEIFSIPGILGFPINGVNTVEVQNRHGYVYVRLRDNQNEVVQAFNTNVSPVYGLPVLLARDKINKSRYVILSRDLGRYENWGTSSPYLPRHGAQHSFDPTAVGGDIVWVYNRQFMPLNAYPSGSFGSMNAIISPTTYYRNGAWHYLGGTTVNLTPYKPSGTSGNVVLIYIDTSDNLSVAGGSYNLPVGFTGTSDLLAYIPMLPTSDSIPIAAIRLVSGTSFISWDNIYDVRPFFAAGGFVSSGTNGHIIADEGTPLTVRPTLNFIGSNVWAQDDAGNNRTNVIVSGTATTGGGSSLPSQQVGFGNGSSIIGDTRFLFATGTHSLTIGDTVADVVDLLSLYGFDNGVDPYIYPSLGINSFSNALDTYPSIFTYAFRGRNSIADRLPVASGDKLFQLSAYGWASGSFASLLSGFKLDVFTAGGWWANNPPAYHSPSYFQISVGSSGTSNLEGTPIIKGDEYEIGFNNNVNVSGTVRLGGFIMPNGAFDGYVLTSNAVGIGTWQLPAGGGGGGTIAIQDDGVFKVSGTAISFDDNLFVSVVGSVAHVSYTGTASTPASTSATTKYTDEFLGGTTTAGSVGDLNWWFGVSGGGIAITTGEPKHPGLLQVRSGAALNNYCNITLQNTAGLIDATEIERTSFLFRMALTVSGTFWRVGYGTLFTSIANLGQESAYVEYFAVSGTNSRFFTRSGGNQEVTLLTTVSGTLNNWNLIDIIRTTGTNSIQCWVNGTLLATHTNVLPSGSVTPALMVWNTSGSTKGIDWDWFEMTTFPIGQRWT